MTKKQKRDGINKIVKKGDEYEKMKDIIEIIQDDEICRLLDEATEQAKKNPKRYSHEEVFSKARSIVNEAKKVRTTV